MIDFTELERLALRAAAAAAAVHHRSIGRVRQVETKSSVTDMVTEVDREAEHLIVGILREARPHDSVLAEEETLLDGTSGVRWIVDPLDGTTNYIYSYPA